MKTIIFSDTHLTKSFNKRKFEAIYSVVESADKVIINGDFWDGYFITLDDFLDSKWNKLFGLLKSKNTICLFGNHDTPALVNKKSNEFCLEYKIYYKLTSDNKVFHIEHGNRLAPELSAKYPWLKRNMYFLKKLTKLESFAELILNKALGNMPFKEENNKMKERKDEFCHEKEFLVCGHSHRSEIDLGKKYINTGGNKFSPFKYLVVEDGEFELKAADY